MRSVTNNEEGTHDMLDLQAQHGAGSLVLGGNVFGWTANEEQSFAVLDRFLERGGKMVDTADGYSHWVPGHKGGESEEVIGRWLVSRGAHGRMTVATKVSTHPEYSGLDPLNVRRAAEASLGRLGIEMIDLYWAHFDDPDTPIVETAAAFSDLKREGKIGAIGLSNYSAERVAEWFEVARAENLELPVALQPHYNLVERDYETNGLRAIAETESLKVFPYFALAAGFLTGKYRSANDAEAEGASPRAGGALQYLDARGEKVLAALDSVAATHEAKVAAVAVAWLRQQPTITAPISSARTLEQLEVLGESVRLELSDAELASLTEASSTAA